MKVTAHRAFTQSVGISGSIATGDRQAFFVVPFKKGFLRKAILAFETNGVTGTNSVMLSRVREAVEANFFAATLDVAHDSSSNILADQIPTQSQDLQQGDIVAVDVDAVASGTAPTNLGVTFVCEVTEDY